MKAWPYDAIVEWRKEIDFPVEFKTIAKNILISKRAWFTFYSKPNPFFNNITGNRCRSAADTRIHSNF